MGLQRRQLTLRDILKLKYFLSYLSEYKETYYDEKFLDANWYDTYEIPKKSNDLIKKLYKEKRDKGLYVFYNRIELENDNEVIIPLYAGRTVTFLTRFNQYQNIKNGTWYDKYFDALCENLIWNFDVYFSLIVISDYEENKLKEHKLIYDMNPIFNAV
jgi:hypothetical protein